MPLSPEQRNLVRVVTAIIAERGFALAGAGALMEHGFVSRHTEDIDLFTNIQQDVGETAAALAERLSSEDFDVKVMRQTPHFARLSIDDLEVDLARNWRADPVDEAEIGPLLSVRDAIAGKVEALCTRLENRDVHDVGQLLDFYSMAQMAAWAKERDGGFSLQVTLQMVTQNVHRPNAGFGEDAFDAARVKVLAAIEQALDQPS